MYTALKHAHLATSALTLLLSLLWMGVAWRGLPAATPQPCRTRVVYGAHRALAGLAALSGLTITLLGPWRLMLFPYLGLAAFVGHELAAGASRRLLTAPRPGRRQGMLILQLSALLLAAALMGGKPF